MINNIRNVLHGTFLFKVLFLFICLISISFKFIDNSVNAMSLPALYSEANLLMDADSGIIYVSDNIDKKLGIASLTKLMSLYIVFEKIESGEIKLKDKVTISKRAASIYYENFGEISGLPFVEGQQMIVEDLIDLALIYSDNGATIALSEIASGSEEEHVKKMNTKAKELGMNNTKFYNVTGLTMSSYGDLILQGTNKKDYNKSTARDLGILSYNLIYNYPKVLEVTQKNSVFYQGNDYPSWNQMLKDMTFEYEGVVGLKTGTTKEAGECFISYYKSDGKNYISVVLDTPNQDGVNRFTETAKIYDWIKEQSLIPVLDKEKVYQSINIKGDTAFKVDLYPQANINILKSSNVHVVLEKEVYNPKYFGENNILNESIKTGEVVKTLYFNIPKGNTNFDSALSNNKELKLDLIAKKDINKSNFIVRFFAAFNYFIEDLFK